MGASESRTAGRPAAQRGARPQDRFYSPDQSPSRATRPVQLSPSFPPQPSTLHPAHAYPSAYGESVVHDVPGTTTEDATTATPTVSTPRRPRPARRRVRTRADKLVLCVKPTQSGKTFEMVESVWGVWDWVDHGSFCGGTDHPAGGTEDQDRVAHGNFRRPSRIW